MEHKIFLGKYRVGQDKIAQVAAEPASVSVGTATEQVTTARTYRGDEIDSGRDVNIEVLPAGTFKPAVRTKLEKEAIAAKEIDHINIPALYDFGIEDDQLIYVTEYFEGASAEEWVNEHGPMPTGAVLRIALQVMGAMGAAAFHKISHHAINPANLILVPGQTPEGDWPLVKVLHFIGVAPTFTGGDMSVAAFDKSTHYASPEQLQGQPVDFRSEIYSLGATMWFLLTGAPPLMAPKGPLAMQPTTIGLAIDKLNGMPKKVRRLLAQMLSVKPEAQPPAKTEPAPAVAANPPPSPPVQQSETAAPPANNPPAEAPKVAANETKPVGEEKPATTQPKESVRTEVREEKPKRNPEVAVARPALPEVRRAEPAPPAEGPEEVSPAPEKKIAPSTTAKKERTKKPKREPADEEIARAEPSNPGDDGASEAPAVSQLPRGRTRAKFIGVTADGNWMFSLPSKKIVIVPPPPGG